MKKLLVLIIAALLETGGDAMVRMGLQGKLLGFVLGAAVLFAYGLVVNITSMDFGKLMGVYIVVFFVVSQIISRFVFHEALRPAIFVGGALIVAGGITLSIWR